MFGGEFLALQRFMDRPGAEGRRLLQKQLCQPERLTFSDQGELNIASGGSNGSAEVIVKYPRELEKFRP